MNTLQTEHARQHLARFPLLARHIGQSYLVKYGGAAMESEQVRANVCAEIATLSALGIKIFVVHGGGKEISRVLNDLGIESHFVGGLRVTNSAAMAATEMVLSGTVNKDLVSRITHSGAPAIGISGRDAHILEATKIKGPKGEDLGFTGEVTSCSTTPLISIAAAGLIPVISPIAETATGSPLNVNADYAAAALAGALKVSGCIFLTDVDGVRNGSTVEPTLTSTQISALISAGTITGGMIPKVNCALKAILLGCHQAIICNAAKPAIVSQAILRSTGSGTAVVGN